MLLEGIAEERRQVHGWKLPPIDKEQSVAAAEAARFLSARGYIFPSACVPSAARNIGLEDAQDLSSGGAGFVHKDPP